MGRPRKGSEMKDSGLDESEMLLDQEYVDEFDSEDLDEVDEELDFEDPGHTRHNGLAEIYEMDEDFN